MASHPEQGWSLLCNGVVLFEDTGELLPDGRVVAPHRPTDFGQARVRLLTALTRHHHRAVSWPVRRLGA